MDQEEEASQAFQGVASLGAVLLELEEAHPEVGVQQVAEVEETDWEETPLQSLTVITLT